MRSDRRKEFQKFHKKLSTIWEKMFESSKLDKNWTDRYEFYQDALSGLEKTGAALEQLIKLTKTGR